MDGFVSWAQTVDWQAWATLAQAVAIIGAAIIAARAATSAVQDYRKVQQLKAREQALSNFLQATGRLQALSGPPHPLPGRSINSSVAIEALEALKQIFFNEQLAKDRTDLAIHFSDDSAIRESYTSLFNEINSVGHAAAVIMQNEDFISSLSADDTSRQHYEEQIAAAFSALVDPERRDRLEAAFKTLNSALEVNP